jgi:hypothetical protein
MPLLGGFIYCFRQCLAHERIDAYTSFPGLNRKAFMQFRLNPYNEFS